MHQRLEAELLCLACRHHDHGCGAVVHSRSIAGGDGAILFKGRLEGAQAFDGSIRTDGLVAIKSARDVALFLRRDVDGQHLLSEAAMLLGLGSAAMRLECVGILLLSGDAVFLSDILAGQTHVVVVEDIPKAIVNHRVDDLRVAHAKAVAALRQQVGCVAHGLHATGDDDLRVTGLDRLDGETDGLEARAADLVDGERADFRRQATVQC